MSEQKPTPQEFTAQVRENLRYGATDKVLDAVPDLLILAEEATSACLAWQTAALNATNALLTFCQAAGVPRDELEAILAPLGVKLEDQP